MRQLFEDRDRPLYGSAVPVRLHRLADEDISGYVARRFEDTGRRSARRSTRWSRPRRAIRSARCCSRTAFGRKCRTGRPATLDHWSAAYESALAELDPELDARWRGFDLAEQKTLRAVISGDGSPYRERVLQLLDLSKATAQSALKRLAGDGGGRTGRPAPAARRPALRRVDRAAVGPPASMTGS